MRLTTHFTLEELTFSSTALRLGIDNSPPPDIVANLTVLAEGLEKLRSIVGLHNNPIHVDSGYRCLRLNTAVRGAKNSAHMHGFAADIIIRGFTPAQVCRIVAESELKFDKLIMEGTWTHVSFDPQARRIVMTAKFDDHGVPSYTNGLEKNNGLE